MEQVKNPYHSRLCKHLETLQIDPTQPLGPEGLHALLVAASAEQLKADEWIEVLEKILDTMEGVNCHLMKDGSITGISEHAPGVFGVPMSELVGKTLLDVVRIETELGVRLTHATIQRPRKIPRARVFRADGSSYVASVTTKMIAEGEPGAGTVLSIVDVEDRVAQERALHNARIEALAARKSERNTARFLANMSHELRTPLNAIIGYSELMLDDARATGDESKAALLDKVTHASRHLASLIGSILDLSKVEAGMLQLNPESLDLVPLVTQLLEMVRDPLESSGVALTLEAAPELVLRTDAMRVRQVALNMLSNAQKFTPQGSVHIRVAACPPGACIEVTDTGIGMTPDVLLRVFHEFEQANLETALRFGGTGLGLPLSRKLCRLLGGDLTATSTPGKGSTFTMTLADLPPSPPGG